MNNRASHRKNVAMILVVTVLLVLSGGVNCGVPPPSPCADAPARNAKWSFDTGAAETTEPAIGPTGTIYVSTQEPAYLFALDRNGTELWRLDTGVPFSTGVSVGNDGTIYFVARDIDDNSLRAVNPDGTEKWTLALEGGPAFSTAGLGADGSIYVGTTLSWDPFSTSGQGVIYAVSSDGNLKWQLQVADEVLSQELALGPDGTIYAGGPALFAVAPDGSEKWRFADAGRLYTSPTVGSDGTVYLGAGMSMDSGPYFFIAVNPDGTESWRLAVESLMDPASIGPDGVVYFGTTQLNAVDPDGTIRWQLGISSEIENSPAVASDGTLHAGDAFGRLFALTVSDGDLLWCFEFPHGLDEVRGPALDSDGTIYIGSDDGIVYAIESDSPGPADSDWPMYGHDAQHSFRAGGP